MFVGLRNLRNRKLFFPFQPSMSIAYLLETVQNLSSRNQGFAAHHIRLQAQHDGDDERQHAFAIVAHLGGIAGKCPDRASCNIVFEFLFVSLFPWVGFFVSVEFCLGCGPIRRCVSAISRPGWGKPFRAITTSGCSGKVIFLAFLSLILSQKKRHSHANYYVVFCRALVIVLDSKIQSIRLAT